jgi:hypothetical protein
MFFSLKFETMILSNLTTLLIQEGIQIVEGFVPTGRAHLLHFTRRKAEMI